MALEKSKNSKENIHAKHRDRCKDQLLSGGYGDATPPHLLLEMLLFYAIAQKDTNELAHQLLDRYGTLENLFNAPANELLEIDGVGKHTAALLKLFPIIQRRVLADDTEKTNIFNDYSQVGEFLVKKLFGLTTEHIVVMCVTNGGKLMLYKDMGEGSFGNVAVTSGKIFTAITGYESTNVILCHNHPGGVAEPSQVDIESTKGIVNTLGAVGINVMDHVIVSGNKYFSMSESNRFNHIF